MMGIMVMKEQRSVQEGVALGKFEGGRIIFSSHRLEVQVDLAMTVR